LSTNVQPQQFPRSNPLPLGWFIGLVVGLMPLIGFASADSPLPKVEEVVKRALERGKLEEENELKFKQQYYFVRSRKTEIRNSDGDIKKSKTKISTNSPLAILALMAAQPSAVRQPMVSPKQAVSAKTEMPEIPPEVPPSSTKKVPIRSGAGSIDLISSWSGGSKPMAAACWWWILRPRKPNCPKKACRIGSSTGWRAGSGWMNGIRGPKVRRAI
jgi:hypothetical protein